MSFLFRPPCRRVSRAFSSLPKRAPETDSCGIPRRPTWSVNELLSSYPVPSLSPETFQRIHDLSALIPPEQGTTKHQELKAELEELIRLVEAVKMVDTDGVATFEREDPGKHAAALNSHNESEGGRSLLKHAARTRDGFYVVDADKPH
ncbi:hypothetical protein R3P38DRAFT_2829672 [Favolaschia claudopus]|uniref:Uncharacterized protein n=1 Tax=Favolaschia claudopus TaxID=2862362 RepID=A0AAW0E7S8_9AGAR